MGLSNINKLLLIISLLCLSISITSCTSVTKENTLNIAAASNMQFAIKEIVAKFEQQSNIDCELILSSSGKLTAQIVEGAPYDVFLSADEKYPKTIFENDLAVEAPKIYAEGKLVLWSATPGIEMILESLLGDDVNHIAIANPKTAPYGRAAQEVLDKSGLSTKVKSKLVFGESISQANRFVTSGSAEIGFTAKSVVLGAEFEKDVSWIEISKNMYGPLSQAAILLKRKDGVSKEAKQFYNFLFSQESKKVLKDFGYSVSE